MTRFVPALRSASGQAVAQPMHTQNIRRLVAIALIGLIGPWGSPPRVSAQAPGVESFVRDPKTPLEMWEIVDYLLRAGQPEQAVPFLKRFVAAKPDDAVYLQIRQKYGSASVVRLAEHSETRPFAQSILEGVSQALFRHTTDPARLSRFIGLLDQTPAERSYAVEELSNAGSYAIPLIVKELQTPNLSPARRKAITEGVGRLDKAAVPALIAVLDGPDAGLSASAAEALGEIRDRRAVLPLSRFAATSKARASVAAADAVIKITGSAPDPNLVGLLTAESRRLYLGDEKSAADRVTLWLWDPAAGAPASRVVSKAEAGAFQSARLAIEAVKLDPKDRDARVNLTVLALDADLRAKLPAELAAQLKVDESDPSVLSDAASFAIKNGKTAAAVSGIQAASKLAKAGGATRVDALIQGLSSKDRRVQFASAKSLVDLNPVQLFPGSSSVVPILARFVNGGPRERAVVIDGDSSRANRLASILKDLGYDPIVATSGESGFRLASHSGDVEMIAVDPHLIQGAWRLSDTLANLKADARTAGIPTFVYGPLDLSSQVGSRTAGFEDVPYLVGPTETTLFRKQLESAFPSRSARPFTAAERLAHAALAVQALAKISRNAKSAFRQDLPLAEASLILALNVPETAREAATALGETPSVEAQRFLADALLDPSRPAELRINAAERLTRSIKQFGPLLARDQEARLSLEIKAEADPSVRTAFESVIGALTPKTASARGSEKAGY